MSNDKRVYRLLKSKKISVGKAEDGTFLCSIPHNGNKEILDIHSSNFRIAFKSFWKKEYGELLNDKEVQEIISILEVECYESKNKIQRNHRIYTKGRMLIYQLNTDNNTSVRIEDAGYISYNKSYTKNFLGHKRVTVRDVSQYEYVKGNFPAIVSEETWNRVQAIKSKKVVIVDGRKCSKPISKDKWCRHLVCECGSVYGKYKWRTNKNGEVSNGYQCRHQIRYRKRSFHEKQGLDGTGYCNVPSICEWKLDFMAKSILERLWKDQKSSVEELLQDIQDNYSEETGITDREYQIEKLKRESERLKNRMSNLVDMKLDDLIGSEEFEDKKCTIDERMLQIKNELAILSQDEEDNEPVEVEGEITKIKEYLNGVCDLNQKQLSDELVDAVIARITPMENGAFKWYIQGEEYDTEISFDESKYVLYDRFTLNFEEAKKYRKAFGNFIRAVQWKDLIVEVYIRQD